MGGAFGNFFEVVDGRFWCYIFIGGGLRSAMSRKERAFPVIAC